MKRSWVVVTRRAGTVGAARDDRSAARREPGSSSGTRLTNGVKRHPRPGGAHRELARVCARIVNATTRGSRRLRLGRPRGSRCRSAVRALRRKAIRGGFLAAHGPEAPRNPTAEEWREYSRSCGMRDMGTHLCALPTGATAPAASSAWAATTPSQRRASPRRFRQMLVGHRRERARALKHGERAGQNRSPRARGRPNRARPPARRGAGGRRRRGDRVRSLTALHLRCLPDQEREPSEAPRAPLASHICYIYSRVAMTAPWRRRPEPINEEDHLWAALAGRVAAQRRDRGLSQRELADLCGTTQSAIARVERGARPPRLDTLLRIARALDCELVVELRPRTVSERKPS